MSPLRLCTGLGWVGDPHGAGCSSGEMSKQIVDLLHGRVVMVEYKELGLGSGWFRARAPGSCAGGCEFGFCWPGVSAKGSGHQPCGQDLPIGEAGLGQGRGQNNGSGLEFFV